MGLRTDTLLYAQILGILLFIQYYETDLIFTDPQQSATKAPVSSLQGLLRHISYPNALFYYGKAIYGLLALLGVSRLYRPNLLDLFYLITLGFNAYWFVTFLQPAITQFTSFATPDTARAFFPQLFFYQNVYLISLLLLLVESLLASFVYYIIDPIENILMNILLGVLLVDLSYDLPFIANPTTYGSQQFSHTIHGIGSAFLELQIPIIMISIGIIILYRVIVQKSPSDLLILLAFLGSAASFQFFLVPIEVALSKTTYSQGNTQEDQKKVAYAHVAFTTLLLAVTSFKWTTSWWSYQYKPRPSVPAHTPVKPLHEEHTLDKKGKAAEKTTKKK